jgi:hypothetical protein
MFLIALARFLFCLIALVARVRHGHEMLWLAVVLYSGCTRVGTTPMAL